MEYEWDPEKAASNFVKHGVAFEDAEAFDWNQASVKEDRRQQYGEPRFVAVGPIGGRLHVLVFTSKRQNPHYRPEKSQRTRAKSP